MTHLIVCPRCFKKVRDSAHTCSPSGFEDPAQLLDAYRTLAYEHAETQRKLAECHDAMNVFVFRVNLGQIKSVNTYAQFLKILQAHGVDHAIAIRAAASPEATEGQPG